MIKTVNNNFTGATFKKKNLPLFHVQLSPPVHIHVLSLVCICLSAVSSKSCDNNKLYMENQL